MIRHTLVGLALLVSVVAVPAASAQAPAVADSGIKATSAILRVSLYRYADGMQQAAPADMRTHLIPIWEAYRAAGIIQNYSTMTNTTASSKDDWQLRRPRQPGRQAGADHPQALRERGSPGCRGRSARQDAGAGLEQPCDRHQLR